MTVLLQKELRALRPFALLIVGFLLMMVAGTLAMEFPDKQPLDPHRWLAHDRDGPVFAILLFGMMTGAGLLVGESTQGTLNFLDALPVSRTRIFFEKLLAGLLVMSLVPVLGMGMDTAFGLLSRTSTDGPFPWTFIGMQVGLQSLGVFYVLAVALAFSFFRQWFALATGVVFWLFVWLRSHGANWTALFDPSELFTPGLDGARIVPPWRHVAAQASVGIVALGIAWAGFVMLGSRAQHFGERVARSRLAGLFRFIGRGLVPLVWIGALMTLSLMVKDDTKPGHDQPVHEAEFGSTETRRYEFLFRESQRKAARELIAAADSVHDTVAGFLNAAPVPSRIVVDLASPVVQHAVGQTNWTKIRVPLNNSQSLDTLKLILGHETTHVFIDQLSDGAMTRFFPSTQFFHEGLATFVEQKFFGSPGDRRGMQRLSAAAHARGRVTFDMLANSEALGKKRDETLVYPLGEIFCRALVETHGNDAPGKLLRAFARPHAPSGLKGAALWRDAMQACGYSLDRVVSAYDAGLDRAVREEADFLARIPRITATVGESNGNVVIQPHFDGKKPGNIVCFIGVSREIGEDHITLWPDNDGMIRFPRSESPGPTIRYMLGWVTKETRLPIFEPWAEKTL